ncbi:MAG: aldo/keto reductase [Pirellulales bacterium]|nr:aldo/keto reductase [Pirellulales bacterium]
MNYRKLGNSGWDVSEVGFGGWALGGQWGGQDDNDSIAALNKAIDLGLNFIDTAEGYGNGRSERVIAGVLRERSEQVYVATKTPPKPGPWPPTPYCTVEARYPEDYLRANVETRLKNLGTDCLDVLQLHSWTRAFNRDPAPLEILRRLRQEGKLRLIGISTPEQDQNCVVDLMRRGYVDVIQIIYNLFEQEPAAEILPVARETGTGVIVRVVFDEGVLTGKYSKGHTFPADDFRSDYFAGDRLDRAADRVEEIRADVAEAGLSRDLTLAEVALKFVLAHPSVSTVIPGIRNARQAELNLSVSDRPDLPAALLAKLRRHNWLRGVWYAGK